MNTEILSNYNFVIYILKGIFVTLQYSIISVFFGFLIGIFITLLKVSPNKALKFIGNFYTSIFRGTPLMIQLSIIYFATPQLFGIKFSPFFAGVLAFSLNSGAYVSEIIRGGIESIDEGQYLAAKALGIPYFYTMKDIILPQVLPRIFPSLINELVNLVKESAIISIIGEVDLMRRAQFVAASTYNYFTPMLAAALGYYIIVLLFSYIASIFEKRLKTYD